MAKKTGKSKTTTATAKAPRRKPKVAKEKAEKKPILTKVVSFRVTDGRHDDATKDLDKQPVFGCKSVSDFARKIFADYMNGRLVYKEASDRKVDYDKFPNGMED